MTPILVFDLETIPDLGGLRRIDGTPDFMGLSDADILAYIYQERRATVGNDFLPHYLHKIIAISCVLRLNDGAEQKFAVWSLGELQETEGQLIKRFYDLLERWTPQLVSWNGGGFDLPVLHYRSMIHQVAAPRYWDWGDAHFQDSRDFRFNNYLNRYHTRHIDLMDLLSLYQPRSAAPLDKLAKLCGLPGKLGMDGSQVLAAWQSGALEAIRQYCETDVLNTYLLFLRFRFLRGEISAEEHLAEVALVKRRLSEQVGAHWLEYLAQWE